MKDKLLLALNLIEEVTQLLEDNEYQQFFYSHLISMQVELNRQLSNVKEE